MCICWMNNYTHNNNHCMVNIIIIVHIMCIKELGIYVYFEIIILIYIVFFNYHVIVC